MELAVANGTAAVLSGFQIDSQHESDEGPWTNSGPAVTLEALYWDVRFGRLIHPSTFFPPFWVLVFPCRSSRFVN